MSRTVFIKFFVLLILSLFSLQEADCVDFYVSPSGSDNNPGSRAQPFAGINRTLLAIKEFYSDKASGNCTVWLDNGTYNLKEPLLLSIAELNKKGGKLVFKARAGTRPVITGGIKVSGWEKLPEGLWKAEIPEKAGTSNTIRELFVNDRPAVRARFPNNGYLRVKKAGADRRTHFFFAEGDFPVPEKAVYTELVLLHDWSISRIPVKEINVAESKLTAVDSIGAKNPAFFNLDHWEAHPRYFLENDMRFLDADYEWYFDSEKKFIYLKLPKGLNPDNQEVVIPVSEGLVIIRGREEGRISDIHFHGITFKHSAWEIPEMGYCGVQACHYDSRPAREGWAVVPAAVHTEWAENCSFTSCTFRNLGGSGLWLGAGSRNCSVENSLFENISGNGIMIGEGRDRAIGGEKWWKAAPSQAASGNKVEKCVVTGSGRQFFGAVGIWCGLTSETIIRNNELAGLPYTGISVGWMWSPEPTPCRNNTIEGNHIHHIMQTLSDGGGIYMLGLQPGSTLKGNRIHDVLLNAGRAESNGMFLDEGTTDVMVSDNLIYSVARSPLRFHRATVNIVKDNYLFCGNEIPPIRYNTTKEEDIKKENNKVFSETDAGYGRELEKAIQEWEEIYR